MLTKEFSHRWGTDEHRLKCGQKYLCSSVPHLWLTPLIFWQEVLQHLGAAQHARHARAGMGSGADEIEILDSRCFVVKTEIGRLPERRLNGKTRAVQGC